MYSINTIPLDNKVLGWRLLRASSPLPSLSYNSVVLERSGRDGARAMPSTRGVTTITFTVETNGAGMEPLFALFTTPSLSVTKDDRPGVSATATLVSTAVESYHPAKDRYQHSFMVEIRQAAWRGSVVTTPFQASATSGATLTLFPGISAPVQDALVRIKGPITNPVVTDDAGSFFTLTGSIAAGSYVRFDMNNGRAWLTTSDTWAGGTEVSGLIDFGGPRGVFEITPKFTSPTTRIGSVRLTQTTQAAGAGFQVRGQAAHLL